MKYLVIGNEGPGFFSVDEAIEIIENVVLPAFEELEELETEGSLVGGVPVGERSLAFIIEADSHDEVDRTLRSLPMWGAMEWEVTPLQDFELRTQQEREILKDLKKKS
ncbi:MAG: muconolactone Delta-isomerase family protein [Thermodesulfobacteriota bacterium]